MWLAIAEMLVLCVIPIYVEGIVFAFDFQSWYYGIVEILLIAPLRVMKMRTRNLLKSITRWFYSAINYLQFTIFFCLIIFLCIEKLIQQKKLLIIRY